MSAEGGLFTRVSNGVHFEDEISSSPTEFLSKLQLDAHKAAMLLNAMMPI